MDPVAGSGTTGIAAYEEGRGLSACGDRPSIL